jgi:glycosyltransferase involved in cell wall biosynthesis
MFESARSNRSVALTLQRRGFRYILPSTVQNALPVSATLATMVADSRRARVSAHGRFVVTDTRGTRRTIWLLQDGEPLPIDSDARLMRTGEQAVVLLKRGYDVTWWTSRFSHNLKAFRQHPHTTCELGDSYRIVLLDGNGYPSNMSLKRMLHYRAIAAHFTRIAETCPRPSLILASYPSPELCEAGSDYARRHGVPFVFDIRDPWPDIFAEYLPEGLRWAIKPVSRHYHRKIRSIARNADGLVAVSQGMFAWGLEHSGRAARTTDRIIPIGFRRRSTRVWTIPERFTEESPLVCLFATTCGRSYDGHSLVAAARRLEERGERRIKFVVSGDGEMRKSWMEMARGLKTIVFTGWISNQELQAHFERAHVGLVLLTGGITRYWLGNKIFEYMASSLALVNNVGGEASDLVGQHGLGANVPAGDSTALADVLAGLANDPVKVNALMTNSIKVFLEHFDREHVLEKYVDYLDQFIARSEGVGEKAGTSTRRA